MEDDETDGGVVATRVGVSEFPLLVLLFLLSLLDPLVIGSSSISLGF